MHLNLWSNSSSGSSECCESVTLSATGGAAEELPWLFGNYSATGDESQRAPVYNGGAGGSWQIYKYSDGAWHGGFYMTEKQRLEYGEENWEGDIKSVGTAPCPDSISQWEYGTGINQGYDTNDGTWRSANITVKCS